MQEEQGKEAVDGFPDTEGKARSEDPEAEPVSGLRRTTLTAMLHALYLVVDTIPSPIPGLLKFTGFSQILAGFMIGPWAGAIVGGLGDLLHYALHPRGAYLPFFTITGASTADAGAVVFFLTSSSGKSFGFRILIAALFLGLGTNAGAVGLNSPARALGGARMGIAPPPPREGW